MGSLEREKELRIRQAELYRYRYNGLTKIADCAHFEQHAASATHRSSGPYGHGKTVSVKFRCGGFDIEQSKHIFLIEILKLNFFES